MRIAFVGADPQNDHMILDHLAASAGLAKVCHASKSGDFTDSFGFEFCVSSSAGIVPVILTRINHVHFADKSNVDAASLMREDGNLTAAGAPRVLAKKLYDRLKFLTSPPPGAPGSTLRSSRLIRDELQFLEAVDCALISFDKNCSIFDIVRERFLYSMQVVGRSSSDIPTLLCHLECSSPCADHLVSPSFPNAVETVILRRSDSVRWLSITVGALAERVLKARESGP